MLRKIKLYGHLAKAVGRRTLEAHVASAAEAVRFLLANFPHLESLMVESHYKVSVGDHSLSYDELHHPSVVEVIESIAPKKMLSIRPQPNHCPSS